MPTQQDVVRIALSLPGVTRADGEFSFRVNGRQFVDAWLEKLVTDSYDVAVSKGPTKLRRKG